MRPDSADVDRWITEPEGERLEFKEAKEKFSAEKLAQYCCAMANEGGGRVLLGVTDRRPRRVVGTRAFAQPETLRRRLMEWLRMLVEVHEVAHPDGRVLVVSVPPRPDGMAVRFKNVYWCRQGDSLVPMDEERLRRMFDELPRDFSAQVCPGATMADLDPRAVAVFRSLWSKRAAHARRSLPASDTQLLQDAELVVDNGITFAALVLLGRDTALNRHLPQAEIVFEYRSSETPGPAAQRVDLRRGFLTCHDELWNLVDRRNEVQHFQVGFLLEPVATFDERSVREAILNAVAHRDYRAPGSIFVRQYPRKLVVESPGGAAQGRHR